MNKLNPYSIYRKLFRNPKLRPWIIGLTIIYIISPVDLIPDFLTAFMGVGIIDDGIVLTMFVLELVNWLKSKKISSKDTIKKKI